MKLIRWGENIFIVISIIFFSQGLFSLFIDTAKLEEHPDASSFVLALMSLLIYSTTAAILVLRWKTKGRLFYKNKWILLLLTLAVVSTLWSSVPDITFRKSISLIGTTIFGIYFGTHHSLSHQLRLLGWSFGISIGLSFVFVLLLPSYGVMNTNAIVGAWKGIYLHKSSLGENMFISFLVFYFLAASNIGFNKFIAVLGCCCSVILIVFSKSATSLIALVFVYAILNTLKYLSLRSKLSTSIVFLFLTGLLISQMILILNIDEFLSASSKGITISGRTPLWGSLWEFIQLKIEFGYGYSAFFSASHTETEAIWKLHSWGVMHAHNGYIQILLHVGIFGFSIFMLGYLDIIRRSLISYLTSKNVQFLWIFSFFCYTVIYNLTEVSFMSINHLNWILIVSFSHSLNSIGVVATKKSRYMSGIQLNQ
jgi:exopolysaccharide production protein ExoQ